MSNTPTPRTDALLSRQANRIVTREGEKEKELADFARQLERELNDERADKRNMEIHLGMGIDTAQYAADQYSEMLDKALRVIAWLRSGGHNRFNQTAEGITAESVAAHLASSPPEGWTSPATE